MNQATALLGLMTETSLHAGAGSSAAIIDLPIQREGHNGWPCVFGSAVKGALRSRAENQTQDPTTTISNNDICSVFGPDTQSATENAMAGAIAIGDARLLLLPVRSLTTAFKWVTCPEALRRLKRDSDRLGVDLALGSIPNVTGEQANVVTINENTKILFLEEYRFELIAEPPIFNLAKAIARLMKRDDAEAELVKRLVVISDDMFGHLTQSATPVNAHIALDSATKIVRDGALWYEETLPPETLLYVPLVAMNERREKPQMQAIEILQKVTDLFAQHHWLQLGGNKTVGMGWCAVSIIQEERI